MTNVSTLIKILVSNLVVAALVATYLSSGSKTGDSAVGLKGARQLQPTYDFTFVGQRPTLTFPPIPPPGNFMPLYGPTLPDFSPTLRQGGFTNFPTIPPPGQTVPVFSPIPPQGGFDNFPTPIPPPGNMNSFRTIPPPGLTLPDFSPIPVNFNNDNLRQTQDPNNLLDQVKNLNFTNSNIFRYGGTDSIDNIISGINVSSTEIVAGQRFTQFPSP
jgi:hypothetical protein